ncbi:MAG: hypothetical protein AB9869_04055 [Verrucomicrobiia bacterium]
MRILVAWMLLPLCLNAQRVRVEWGIRGPAIEALRAMYRRSALGRQLLKEDLRVESSLMNMIELDPSD